jgi:hypothetical protein
MLDKKQPVIAPNKQSVIAPNKCVGKRQNKSANNPNDAKD